MKKRSTFIRIMCIFLAVLMLGSVIVVAIQAFAYGPEVAIAATGDNNSKTVVIIIAVIAVIALVGALFGPTIVKKLKK
ncbi:MAG: hypothetical protein Q4F70_03305 [Clostridia bacterium]|nr:hypothetical protein [Clostridia bacterium]